MNLYQFLQSNQSYGAEAIADDVELATHIQTNLIRLKLLSGKADGEWKAVSMRSLQLFQQRSVAIGEFGYLGPRTAKELIEAKPEDLNELPVQLTDGDFASEIVGYCQKKGYPLTERQGELNIVYIEGCGTTGKLNDDATNKFNDVRLVLEFFYGVPKIVKAWEATTEPGFYYIYHPMNPKGAARIAFGYYKAWRVGTHGNSEPHEALVQVLPVKVYRDFNKDGKRSGDKVDEGIFGINQHWGYDLPYSDIKMASAGCLVGRTRAGHKEFMSTIKRDPRYVANSRYIFETVIIPGNELKSTVD